MLQTIKGAPPGNIDLIAPAGIVDAGEAGIPASGTSVQVLNAFNTWVRGAIGIPITPSFVTRRPNTVALTTASKPTGATAAARAVTRGGAP